MAERAPSEWLRNDYYALLGVPVTASREEIIRAYRRLARAVHPDVDSHNPQATERFEQLAAAREVLGNPATRAAYDRARRVRRPVQRRQQQDVGVRSTAERRGQRVRPAPGPAVRPGPVIWVPDAADPARDVPRRNPPW
ncbi:MAG TPA: J domain-containing protein [Jiangellaceae bacterium]|nr:J domain-containing protein [Jiangellaceae bacterium]